MYSWELITHLRHQKSCCHCAEVAKNFRCCMFSAMWLAEIIFSPESIWSLRDQLNVTRASPHGWDLGTRLGGRALSCIVSQTEGWAVRYGPWQGTTMHCSFGASEPITNTMILHMNFWWSPRNSLVPRPPAQHTKAGEPGTQLWQALPIFPYCKQ